MHRIQPIQRTVKLALASLLIVTMLALGGLAATNATADGGISTLISAAQTATQQITASNALQVDNPTGQTNSTSTITTATQQTQPAQQQQPALPLTDKLAELFVGKEDQVTAFLIDEGLVRPPTRISHPSSKGLKKRWKGDRPLGSARVGPWPAEMRGSLPSPCGS